MTTITEKVFKKQNGKALRQNGKLLKKVTRRGLYTPAEITDMINNDNYIPVASASELDNLRNSVSQTMGVGTQWEGTYTTGTDKKYVQVRDIDLSDFAILPAINVYDGNNLNTKVILDRLSYALFTDVLNIVCNLKLNILINPLAITRECGTVSVTNNGQISNCDVTVHYASASNRARLGGITYDNFGDILNCEVTFEGIYGMVDTLGGIVHENYGKIQNCYANINVVKRNLTGGISFRNYSGGIISDCSVDIELISIELNSTFGGLVGINSGIVEKSQGVINSQCRDRSGMLAFSNSSTGIIRNCIVMGSMINTMALNNGIACALNSNIIENCLAILTNGANITTDFGGGTRLNSYYQSPIIISATLYRTTKQLQNGTADSYINPDGSVDGTNAPANAVYTAWSTDKWRFNPKNKYPRLKN